MEWWKNTKRWWEHKGSPVSMTMRKRTAVKEMGIYFLTFHTLSHASRMSKDQIFRISVNSNDASNYEFDAQY